MSDFNDEEAQVVFDDWIVSLPLQSHRMLVVMLMETLQSLKSAASCLFNEETLCLQAAMWVRENALRKGACNRVARKFCQWVNSELLPSSNLSPNLPHNITVHIATQWLRQLGFRPTREHNIMLMVRSVMMSLPTGRSFLRR